MKKALLLSPLPAAVFFTFAASLLLLQRNEAEYVPVIYELLLFVLCYLLAAVLNFIFVIPLCVVLKKTGKGVLAGVTSAFLLALIVTTVAYAWEIFGYESSILHPVYFFPVFIPVLLLGLSSYFYIGSAGSILPARQQDGNASNAAGDTGEA